jgi:hypothetical protein
MDGRLAACLVVSLVLLNSCAPVVEKMEPGRPFSCQEFLETLDRAVVRAGVRNASFHPVPGFPNVRTNRFLSALGQRLEEPGARQAWIEEMARLGLLAMDKEISNLPDELMLSFDGHGSGTVSRKELSQRVRQCSRLTPSQMEEAGIASLVAEARVPDEYSFFQSALGLYPLAAFPVALLTLKARWDMLRWFARPLEKLPVEGRLVAYLPAEASGLEEGALEELVQSSTANPLGIPILDQEAERQVVMALAPVLVQDQATHGDALGRIHWGEGGLAVDGRMPTVYYYSSLAFMGGVPVLQVNYVIWYSQRGGKTTPWFERGPMDGLTLRFTLDPGGRLAMVDVMNNCGCYHFFSPREGLVNQARSQVPGFGPLVPQHLPNLSHGDRLGFRVSSGRHHVQRLFVARETVGQIQYYELVPYEVLEALPRDAQRTESVFDAFGILKGSERAEQFLLFSMGIPRIGSMRQRGHHAIDFFQRAHFDDPYLFDQNFVFR